MRQGDQFPPILVDQDLRVISGNHRTQSYLEEFGPDHEIQVKVKTYTSEAERIEDAIKENAKHGNPLDGISRKKAIVTLSELGVDPERIAKLLNISVRRVEQMGEEVVLVRGFSATGTQAATPQPVKRGLSHMHGERVTKTAYADHMERDRGVSARHMANQLTRWINAGWVDLENEKTRQAIIELMQAIEAKGIFETV
jgi:hypothetical protein